MRHRSLLILTAVLTTGALTLTACGSRDDDKKDSGNGDTQTVVIGIDAPLTGDLSALGLGIKNAADLAVKTANKEKTVPGVTFEIQSLDDQAQPSVGQQNATKFIDNKSVLGVVGPLNSGVSQSMQKPLNGNKPHPDLPRQHRHRADPGRELEDRRQEAPLQDLLPHRHHGPDPGRLRGEVPLQQREDQADLPHRRPEALRRRSRGLLQGHLHHPRRQDRRLRPRQPRRPRLQRRRHQGQEVRRQSRLLRRRIPHAAHP